MTKHWRGALAAAVLSSGRVDAAHPATIAWASSRDIPLDQLRQSARRGGRPSASQDRGDERLHGAQTIAQTIAANPTQDWLNARKTIADIRRIELGVFEKQRSLVSFELVSRTMARALDAFAEHVHDRAAVAIAAALRKAVADGTTAEDRLLIVRDLLGAAISAAKADMVRPLSPSPGEAT